MILGAFFQGFGHHQAAWRHPSTNPDSEFSFEHFLRLTKTAERAKLDFVFLGDSAGIRDHEVHALKRMARAAVLEPITLLAGLAVSTTDIGLIATASTTYNEPYHIARKFASLDQLSKGRIGLNLVTSTSESEAMNFHLDTQRDHGDRYERATEFAAVIKGLWNTWDDGAFVQDRQTGIFFDPERLHFLRHKGKHFSVRGPLNAPPSEQRHPVIVQAGASEDGRALSSKVADLVFAAQSTLKGGQELYRDLKSRAAAQGRAPDSIRILPGLFTVTGDTETEAREKFQELQSLIHPDIGLAWLKDFFGGFDLSSYPLDGPLPDIPETRGGQSRRQGLIDMARNENLSIRQLYERTASSRGFLTLVGTPARIVDELQTWLASDAADGFVLMPPLLPRDLDNFVDKVMPELRSRGLFRQEYAPGTLRERLGLRAFQMPLPTAS